MAKKRKYYLVYKIKNRLNGRIYIGKHIAKGEKEDGYYGSGVLLGKDYKRWGNLKPFIFSKSIIEEYNTNQKMKDGEREWIKHYVNEGYWLYNKQHNPANKYERKRKIGIFKLFLIEAGILFIILYFLKTWIYG